MEVEQGIVIVQLFVGTCSQVPASVYPRSWSSSPAAIGAGSHMTRGFRGARGPPAGERSAVPPRGAAPGGCPRGEGV